QAVLARQETLDLERAAGVGLDEVPGAALVARQHVLDLQRTLVARAEEGRVLEPHSRVGHRIAAMVDDMARDRERRLSQPQSDRGRPQQLLPLSRGLETRGQV